MGNCRNVYSNCNVFGFNEGSEYMDRHPVTCDNPAEVMTGWAWGDYWCGRGYERQKAECCTLY